MQLADPQSLRLFVAVCECGTIARAAAREFIAPSALSKRMADLEELLGVPLLTRSQRGVSPTPAGETLLQHALPLLRDMQRLHAEVGEHAQGIRGHVRIMCIRSALAERLQGDLTHFLANHPHVGLTLDERVSAEVSRGVITGAAEIGVCRDIEPTRELRRHAYGHDTLAIVTGRAHPLASHERLAFADTLDHEHICLGQGNSHQRFTDGAARDAGRSVNYRFYVASSHGALQLIADGLGIGVFPSEAIQPLTALYDLRIIPLTDSWAKRMQYICTSAVEPLSPAARHLLHFLLERHREAEAAQIAA